MAEQFGLWGFAGEAGVEGHAEGAEEGAAGFGDIEAVGEDADEAVALGFGEAGDGLFEEGDLEVGVVPAGLEAGHEVEDVAAEDEVLVIEDVAAEDGEFVAVEAAGVGFDAFFILGEDAPGIADGGDAEAEEGEDGAGGVAHEVAVEGAVADGGPEGIGFEGEVVHADLAVAGVFEEGAAEFVEAAFLFAGGEVVLGEFPLAGFDPGDVGVGVEGDAIGAESGDGLDGVADALFGLEGEAVDEVEVDIAEAGGAGLFGGGADEVFVLDAVDDVLDDGVEVLDAEAEAGEAEAGEGFEVLGSGDAGVGFDGELEGLGDVDVLEDAGDEAFEVFGVEEGGGTAAEVEFGDGDGAGGLEVMAVELPFLEDGIDVGDGGGGVAGDAGVAAAVGAEGAAEGDMDVEGGAGEVLLFLAEGLEEAMGPVVLGGVGFPEGDGGVAGVAGARDVVLGEQVVGGWRGSRGWGGGGHGWSPK